MVQILSTRASVNKCLNSNTPPRKFAKRNSNRKITSKNCGEIRRRKWLPKFSKRRRGNNNWLRKNSRGNVGMQTRRHDVVTEYPIRPRRNTLPRSRQRAGIIQQPDRHRSYDDHADHYQLRRSDSHYEASSPLRASKRISSSLPEGQLRPPRTHKKVVHFLEENGYRHHHHHHHRRSPSPEYYPPQRLSRARCQSSYQLCEREPIDRAWIKRRAHSAERSFDRFDKSHDYRDRYDSHIRFSQPIKFHNKFEEDWQKAHQDRLKKQREQHQQLQTQRLQHQRLQHQRFIRQNQRIEDHIQKRLQKHRQEEIKREVQFNQEQERSKKLLEDQQRLRRQRLLYRQIPPGLPTKKRQLPLPAPHQCFPSTQFPHPLQQVSGLGLKSKARKEALQLQPHIPFSQLNQFVYPVPVHQPTLNQSLKQDIITQQIDVIQHQQEIQQQQINNQIQQHHQLQHQQILQDEKLHQQRVHHHKVQEQHLKNQHLHKERLQAQRTQQQHLQQQRLHQQQQRIKEDAQRGPPLGDLSYIFRGTSVEPGLRNQPVPGFFSQVQAAITKRIKTPSPITLPRFASSSFSPRNVFHNLPQVHTKIPSVHTFGAPKRAKPKIPKTSREFLVNPIPAVVVAPTSCRIPEGKSPKRGGPCDKRDKVEFADPSLGAIPKVRDQTKERRSCLPSCDPRGDHLLSQLKESVNLDVSHLVHDLWSAIQNLTDSISMLDNVYGLADGPTRSRGETSLEHVLMQMKEAAERRKELEKQHAEALLQLHQKQAALEGALGSSADRKDYADTIEALQSKIRELEKKAEVQNLRHEELLLEMQSIKKIQGSPKNSWSRSGSLSAELQSPESGDITPAGLHPFNLISSGAFTSTTASSFITSGQQPHSSQNTGVSTEIDRILAKIEQDNRILAELDKTRSTIGITLPSTSHTFSTAANSFRGILTDRDRGFTKFSSSRTFTPIKTTNSSLSYPLTSTATTVAALDLSQPLTNPLVNTFSNPIESLLDPNLSNLGIGLGGTSSFPGITSSLTTGSLFTNPLASSPGVLGLGGVGGLNMMGENILGGGNTFPTTSSLPTIITTLYDNDDTNLVNGNLPGLLLNPCLETDNRMLDVLEIPGKGRCHIYIARYSYDPFQQSPNENPEAELALNAGDYVLVWGQMDEVSPRTIDGFFDGELLDGRRGLVPSNFVEKLVGDDLIEFHQSIVMGLRDCDESVSTSVPQDLDFISQDDTQMLIELGLNQPHRSSISSYLDLEDIMEEEEEPLADQVPPPVQLTLERQLNKSILIGWNPPPDCIQGTIEAYHVYVNGLLKTTVKASERTRALVEGVDSSKLHRISVRGVTPNRRTSRDAACTMIIGKNCPLSPTSVKATNITSTSAVISWMPSNSNFQHSVCVNSVEVRTVKPGVYRHTITGLSPNTTYRVSIIAKNIRAPQFVDQKAAAHTIERLSASIEFRTLPKGWRGLPDPPVDVQVEMGPQDGSLLVTWLPVTLNNCTGTSNGVPVTGYAVYADGKKVTEVDSPTGDHALIDLTKIHGFEPKQITVRTKSRESVSSDSVPTLIPSHFSKNTKGKFMQGNVIHQGEGGQIRQNQGQATGLMEPPLTLRDRLLGRKSQPVPGTRTDHLGQTVFEHDDNFIDNEMYPGHSQGAHGGINALHPHYEGGPPHQPSLPLQHNQQIPPQQHHQQVPPQHHQQVPPQHHQQVPPQHHQQVPLQHHQRVPPQHHQQQPPPHLLPQGHSTVPTTGPAKSGLAKLSNSLFSSLGFGGNKQQPQPSQQLNNASSRNRQIGKNQPPGTDPHFENYPEDEYDRGAYDQRHPGQRGRPVTHRQAPRDPRDPRDYKDPHGPIPRDRRDPRDMRGDPRDLRETRDYRDSDRYEDGRQRSDYSRERGRGEHPRIFVALFDYDPPTMSPNPDACDEELGFREGQLIKVFGDKDPDGFYWGETSGRAGYVPCNMVSEVQVDDDRVARELLKESDTGRRRREGSTGRRGHAGDRWGDIYANMPVRKMIAMYDYDPQELSPNVDSEVELSFQTGDIIYVYGDMDDDGFYMGELRDQRGLVPSNFLQDAPHDYDEQRSRRDTLDPKDRPPPGPSTHGGGGRGHGPGVHGPPPPPRPDQRDKRKDPRSVGSKTGTNAQDLRGPMDNLESNRQEPVGISSERNGRSVSRDRARSQNRAPNLQTSASSRRLKDSNLDPKAESAPAISSADLDQLMMDFDLDDMDDDFSKPRISTTAGTTTTASTDGGKLGGLAGTITGGITGGISSGLSSIGKIGDLAKDNPITGGLSKVGGSLFKKFGL